MYSTRSQHLNNRTKIKSCDKALLDYLKQLSVKIAKEGDS